MLDTPKNKINIMDSQRFNDNAIPSTNRGLTFVADISQYIDRLLEEQVGPKQDYILKSIQTSPMKEEVIMGHNRGPLSPCQQVLPPTKEHMERVQSMTEGIEMKNGTYRLGANQDIIHTALEDDFYNDDGQIEGSGSVGVTTSHAYFKTNRTAYRDQL